MRNLPKHAQLRLVDTFFFGQRMALLGEPEPGIWRDSSTHFAPLMNPSTPLNHTLSLVGRHNEAQSLYDACINTGSQNENSKRIIYLVGAAGIGKSRLLKHIVDKIEAERPDIRVWFWDGISIITKKDLESLGEGQKILVADGCRKADALIPLFDFVFRNQNITLIVATRFDEYDRLRSEAVDVGILGAMVEEIRLNPLSESETAKIALEILKLNHGNESMAQHIAKWTTGSPLATVLSTQIALRETISFAKVRGHKEYKECVKGKFSKLLVGKVGQKNDQASIQQILKVLALVQPFDIHNDRLVECIGKLESLESATIKRVLRILIEAGVLLKKRNNDYSLSPEVLSDLIIEDVCLGVENKSTGYADTLYEVLNKYASAYISNLIYNLSRFEWTANMHVTDTVFLLDSIWSNLQDSEEDIEIIDRVAYYQPKRTIDSIAKMMIARLEENVRPDSFSESDDIILEARDLEPYDKHSQEYLNKLGKDFVSKINNDIQSIMKSIFDDLTPIIQTVALHKDFLAQACCLLWEISKYYDASSQSLSANYNHPIRILKEIFSYKPDKPQDYLTVVIDWATDLLKTYNAIDYPFSPFDFLREIMKTDGSTMEVSGHSITTTGFTINNYEFVAPLRSKVIDAFLKSLVSSNIKKLYRAAKFLPSCLSYSDHHNCSWTKEAIYTLERIKIVVEDQKIKEYALIALRLEIDQLLLRDSSAITNLLSDIKAQINKTIQKHIELCIFAVMMGGSYEFLWYNEKYKTKIEFNKNRIYS